MPASPQPFILPKLSQFTVSWPLDLTRLFPKPQPLLIEIGFGSADFLLHLAHSRPDCNIIGFEISSQSMDKAERKITARKLKNVRPIHAAAETALAHLLPPASVQEFHINYPDPWFKKKHHRRRLIQRATVDLLASRLQTGGRLLLATDIPAYAQMTDQILSATPALTNDFAAAWLPQIKDRFRTKYELKAQREGRRGHYFSYQRNHRRIAHPPPIEDSPMPHLFLQSPLSPRAIAEGFAPTRTRAGDVHIAILQACHNPQQNSALFEVVVSEPTIEQHTMILLAPRSKPAAGEYIVKMTRLGHARPTGGMHRAVQAVGEYIASQHEGARITARKLRG